MNGIWTKKYLPVTVAEVMQQKIGIVKQFVQNYRKGQKAVLIHGPVGCGKTSSAYAVANELGYEVVELNASDFRNEGMINSVAGTASKQMSLFSKGKIILVDELDGIGGNEDRGGIGAIQQLVEESAFPVVITANDISDRKFSAIVKKSIQVEFSPLTYEQIHGVLESIAMKEGVKCEEGSLKKLAFRAHGDLRGAINDFQMLAEGTKRLAKDDVEGLSDRDREETITGALLKIFKSSDLQLALNAFNEVDMELEKCMAWIDENLPYEYKSPIEIRQGYNSLSRADVFSGRIRRWQHWRFLVYVNALITAGVAISKQEKNKSHVIYKQNSRPLKIYIANLKYGKMKSIAQKIAYATGSSQKKAVRQYMPYMKLIFTNKVLGQMISEELELSPEEENWLRA